MLPSGLLILVHYSVSPHKIKTMFPEIQWVFCGKDYIVRKKWENTLGNDLKINYKKQLTEISYRMRDEFVAWSEELGQLHWNHWEWWITRLATRSINPVYLYLCYLEVLKQIINRRTEPLIIISESWELIEIIKENWGKKHKVIFPNKIEQYLRKYYYKFIEVLEFLYSWCKFLLNSVYEWFASRWTKVGHPDKKDYFDNCDHVVIHTCVDDACLGSDGTFSDRYYPGLAEYLKSKGKKVSTLIWLFNVRKRSVLQTFRWFRENQESFLIPQDYYNLYDCLKSAFWVIKSGLLSVKHRSVFKSINVLPLLRSEQRIQRKNRATAYFVNYIAMFRKWKKLGYRLSNYVDTWELKFCEVPAIIAIKKYQFNCKIIAYQHGALLPLMYFCNYKTTKEEFKAAPHADIGIANSELTYNLLIKEGFPVEHVVLGPALRYMYLSRCSKIIRQSNIKIILVCLPLQTSTALELLEICFQAFPKKLENIDLLFKIHPMIPFDKLKTKLSYKWPNHYSIVHGTMEEWIEKVSCLIVAESSTMVEGVYNNICTIIYGKETDIDIIPLDIDKNIKGWKFVLSPNELREEVFKLKFRNRKTNNNLNSFFEFSMESLDRVFN